MPKGKPKKRLERGDDSLIVETEAWVGLLLLAARRGLVLERPLHSFLGRDVDVSQAEATSFAATLEGVWEAASKNPFGFVIDPPVDLGFLLEVAAFCQKGGFKITNEAHA